MTNKKNIVIKVKYPSAERKPANYVTATKTTTTWHVGRILSALGILVLILASLFYLLNGSDSTTVPENPVITPEASTNGPEKPAAIDEKKPAEPVIETRQAAIKEPAIDTVPAQPVNNPINPKTELNKKDVKTIILKSRPVEKKPAVPIKLKDKPVIREPRLPKLGKNVRRALLTYAVNNKEPADAIVRAVNVSSTKPVTVYYFTELTAMNGQKVYHEWLRNGTVVSRYELDISADRWRLSSHKLLTAKNIGNWTVRLVNKNGQLLNEKAFNVGLTK